MADFDEKSGIVPCKTPWGQWWQTMEDVYMEIDLIPGTKSKEITCAISHKHIKVAVRGEVVIEGDFPTPVQPDESLWTLEDKKFLRISLTKSNKTAANCWPSLLINNYKADAATFDQMEQKMTLQRFQSENPGFDFSGADITGNYHGGGPEMMTP